jgi:class 3 adenylate cyclase
MSQRISPNELVEFLNVMFSTFDKIAENHGCEKVKTVRLIILITNILDW